MLGYPKVVCLSWKHVLGWPELVFYLPGYLYQKALFSSWKPVLSYRTAVFSKKKQVCLS